MIYLVAFVVLVLATARLTRLIYFDDLTAQWRTGLKTGSLLDKIAWCPWCASVWASFLTCPFAMGALWLWGGWPLGGAIATTVLLIGSVSYLAGWMVAVETAKTSRGE